MPYDFHMLLRCATQGVMEGVPAGRGYSGGFAAELMVKDLGLALAAARACGAPAPVAERMAAAVPAGSLTRARRSTFRRCTGRCTAGTASEPSAWQRGRERRAK